MYLLWLLFRLSVLEGVIYDYRATSCFHDLGLHPICLSIQAQSLEEVGEIEGVIVCRNVK